MRGHFDFRNMTTFKIGLLALLLALAMQLWPRRHRTSRRGRYGGGKQRSNEAPLLTTPSPPAQGFPSKKPEWVGDALLGLQEQLDFSHRKLANAFNLCFFASTGVSVGRTYVRNLLKQHAYEALHKQQALKHQVPEPEPCNRMWGVDTTCVTDAAGTQHVVLGIVDHGSRWNIALRRLKRFNVYSLAGALLLAFGEYGVPLMLKLDNHPVHHGKWFKQIMRWTGVRLRFTQLARPWQNGRIERLFGTFKACLREFVICNTNHLDRSLDSFRFWYNAVRPHQHLGGRTPAQVWHGIDPYRQAPKQALRFEAWKGRLRGDVLRY